jgi:RNA polymerase sigma factor (sigma-70 family)
VSSDKTITRQDVLTETVENQRGRLLSFIQKMIRNQSEAEDVVQDVFEEFVQKYEFENAIENIGAWLVRVARNKVIDRFRRKKTQDEYRLFAQNENEFSTKEDPEDIATREDLRFELAEAIENLPPDQRDVFIQNELEGRSFEEISQATGVSVNTLLSRKRYAVLALREYLKEVYDEL